MDRNEILSSFYTFGSRCARCDRNYKAFVDVLRGFITGQLMTIIATTTNPDFPAICPKLTHWTNKCEKDIYNNTGNVYHYLENVLDFSDNTLKHILGRLCTFWVHTKMDRRWLIANVLYSQTGKYESVTKTNTKISLCKHYGAWFYYIYLTIINLQIIPFDRGKLISCELIKKFFS